MRINSQYAMSKTTYHISLKGYVGGWDFDRSTVDKTLAKNEGKEVNVFIDSLGGSLATGLSISAAFRNPVKVNVHFVGLNATAATSLHSARLTFPVTQGLCKAEDLLALMKVVGWLSPKKALDCDFVIEITDLED